MNRKLTCVLGSPKGFQEVWFPERKILLPCESALKWGLGEVEPGSSPFSCTAGVASTCAPVADSALASDGQSEVQAVIQQFPYTKNHVFHRSQMHIARLHM